jgi:hypothetical protein
MSKSKNNGVDPEALIERYGADTVRLYTMFTAPPEQSLEWSDEGVEGAARFLRGSGPWPRRADAVRTREAPACRDDEPPDARREVHTALKKALFDYERQQFNTVVSACMTMVNVLLQARRGRAGAGAVLREGLGIVLRLLAPIAPHLTHHLWRELGFGDDILDAGWPAVDEDALAQDSINTWCRSTARCAPRCRCPRMPTARPSRPRRWPTTTCSASSRASTCARSSSCRQARQRGGQMSGAMRRIGRAVAGRWLLLGRAARRLRLPAARLRGPAAGAEPRVRAAAAGRSGAASTRLAGSGVAQHPATRPPPA